MNCLILLGMISSDQTNEAGNVKQKEASLAAPIRAVLPFYILWRMYNRGGIGKIVNKQGII